MQTLLNFSIPSSLLTVSCIDGLMLGHLFKMKSSKIKAPIAFIPDETALEVRII